MTNDSVRERFFASPYVVLLRGLLEMSVGVINAYIGYGQAYSETEFLVMVDDSLVELVPAGEICAL